MTEQQEKIIGYVLLGIGLFLIIYSIYSAYGVFTGAKSPPDVFKFEEQPEVKFASANETVMPEIEIFSPSFLNQVGNLGVYYMLMFLLIFAGGQIAGIGVGMINNIKESS